MVIEAPELASLPMVKHAFFTRRNGVSQGLYATLNGGLGSNDAQTHIAENRQRMAQHLSVAPSDLLSLYQIHSADVVTVKTAWAASERPKADAMVTDRPGLMLGISTADCGPVLFADTHRPIVGAAHAGWRGALTGILEATVDAMEMLGAERGAIVAVLGPTIGREHYEVGPDFPTPFLARDAADERFFSPGDRPEHFLFDLPGYIVRRLNAIGVRTVVDLGLCTYSDEQRFFSYRRTTHRSEADYGRLISAIGLIR